MSHEHAITLESERTKVENRVPLLFGYIFPEQHDNYGICLSLFP